MKIIQGEFQHEILTPIDYLQHQVRIIEKAGRTCYQSERGPITTESANAFLGRIIRRGHKSVVEHSTLTVKFLTSSRGLTHELVRHRLASFSQESTRYVDYARAGDQEVDLDRFEIKVIAPPHKNAKEVFYVDLPWLEHRWRNGAFSFEEMCTIIEAFYRSLRKAGWKPEDARQILPTGLKSEIVMTANLTEWRHVFAMRLAKPAHWEIRWHLHFLMEHLREVIPGVFADFELLGKDKNGCPYWRIDPSTLPETQEDVDEEEVFQIERLKQLIQAEKENAKWTVDVLEGSR